jgi:YVTN family beta-propeller protein
VKFLHLLFANIFLLVFCSYGLSAETFSAFVANLTSDNVTPLMLTMEIETAVLPAITLPATSPATVPVAIAINPDGNTAYVVRSNLSFNHGNVIPINLLNNTVIGNPITLGILPQGIAITPDGSRAYIANSGSGTLSLLNLQTNTLIGGPLPLPSGTGPFAIAITPDGTRAFITDINFSVVIPFDIATNTASNQMIPVEADPIAIAITPNGQKAYVVNQTGNSVTVINLITNESIKTIRGLAGSFQQDIAITPNGTEAFVVGFNSNNDGFISVIDIANDQVVSTFSEGRQTDPTSITIAPDGLTAFVTNQAIHSITPIDITNHQLGTPIGLPEGALRPISMVFRPIEGLSLPPPPPPLLLMPPRKFRGFQKPNRFASQVDYVNVLTWKAPVDGVTPVSYRIYRDAALTHLVAKISAKHRLEFEDHQRKKGRKYTYFIVSVDSLDQQSSPVNLVIDPN